MSLPSENDLPEREISSVDNLQSSILAAALAYWEEKRGDNVTPSRPDIDPLEMGAFLDSIMLLDVESEPRRYRYRLIGTRITETTNRDMTGQYWDEIYSETQYAALRCSLDYVVDSHNPCRSTGSVSYVSKDYVLVEVLDLPLSSNNTDVDMIMRVVDFNA